MAMFSAERQLEAAKSVFEHIGEHLDARFSVELWDGTRIPLGKKVDTPFYVKIRSAGSVGSLIRRPTLENLVRAFATGDFELHGGSMLEFGDIVRSKRRRKLFKNISKGHIARNALPFLFAKDDSADRAELEHEYDDDETGRKQRRRDEKKFIQFHYDLGNAFYKLFLDPEMQYSCAWFRDWAGSLEQAQKDKLEIICRKLRLKKDERFLDIGCGWGGLVCHAAQNFGVKALGVTLSQEQHDFAVEKVVRLGLEDQVEIRLMDYREVEGEFDKIASIGMYEHIGIANYSEYFTKIYELLRDRGLVLNHGITRHAKRNKKRYKKLRPEKRFILKYIFPGSELDHIGHTVEVMEAHRLEVHDVETWREHYALTLRHWSRRLHANREEAIKQVGPERMRMWEAYLAGVCFGFEDGSLRIYQTLASKHGKKGPSELPASREDLYEGWPEPDRSCADEVSTSDEGDESVAGSEPDSDG